VIDVVGKKWSFQFTYPNGAQSYNELWLEKDQAVRLNLTSTDVLHAFYVPVFRVQRNLVPFRQTTLWFKPTVLSPLADPSHNELGGFDAFCTQYCGDGHSKMGARVFVLEHNDFIKKMNELANPFKKTVNGKHEFVPYVGLGKKLYDTVGCATCHTDNGKTNTGPTWQGLYGHDVKLSDGKTVKADDAYIRRSFVLPAADVVQGFPPMPVSYAGVLSAPDTATAEEKMNSPAEEKGRAIIEFIKSINGEKYVPAVSKDKNPELFDADNSPLKDEKGNTVHPESALGIALRAKMNGGGGTSAPATNP